MHLKSTSPDTRSKLGIPASEEEKLSNMQSRHDGVTAGHFEFRKTLDLILRDYQWPNMQKM